MSSSSNSNNSSGSSSNSSNNNLASQKQAIIQQIQSSTTLTPEQKKVYTALASSASSQSALSNISRAVSTAEQAHKRTVTQSEKDYAKSLVHSSNLTEQQKSVYSSMLQQAKTEQDVNKIMRAVEVAKSATASASSSVSTSVSSTSHSTPSRPSSSSTPSASSVSSSSSASTSTSASSSPSTTSPPSSSTPPSTSTPPSSSTPPPPSAPQDIYNQLWKGFTEGSAWAHIGADIAGVEKGEGSLPIDLSGKINEEFFKAYDPEENKDWWARWLGRAAGEAVDWFTFGKLVGIGAKAGAKVGEKVGEKMKDIIKVGNADDISKLKSTKQDALDKRATVERIKSEIEKDTAEPKLTLDEVLAKVKAEPEPKAVSEARNPLEKIDQAVEVSKEDLKAAGREQLKLQEKQMMREEAKYSKIKEDFNRDAERARLKREKIDELIERRQQERQREREREMQMQRERERESEAKKVDEGEYREVKTGSEQVLIQRVKVKEEGVEAQAKTEQKIQRQRETKTELKLEEETKSSTKLGQDVKDAKIQRIGEVTSLSLIGRIKEAKGATEKGKEKEKEKEKDGVLIEETSEHITETQQEPQQEPEDKTRVTPIVPTDEPQIDIPKSTETKLDIPEPTKEESTPIMHEEPIKEEPILEELTPTEPQISVPELIKTKVDEPEPLKTKQDMPEPTKTKDDEPEPMKTKLDEPSLKRRLDNTLRATDVYIKPKKINTVFDTHLAENLFAGRKFMLKGYKHRGKGKHKLIDDIF